MTTSCLTTPISTPASATNPSQGPGTSGAASQADDAAVEARVPAAMAPSIASSLSPLVRHWSLSCIHPFTERGTGVSRASTLCWRSYTVVGDEGNPC